MLNKICRVSFCVPIILNMIALFPFTTHQAVEFNNLPNVSLTSNVELTMISEQLFNKASHELFSYVHINYQGQTSLKNFTDNALERLLNASSNAFLTSTTKSLIKLFDNYELNTSQPEIVTKQKDTEENEFIDNLMKTDVMLDVMHFLSLKGFFKNDIQAYKNTLKEIWFHLYSRTKGINGSSGFEHVFIGERKPRKGITGLHNWISFFFGELSNTINYFGFSRSKEFVNKAVILETYFTYLGKQKMSSMFIGTSPELEIAVYTLCFFIRPNKRCKMSFMGFKFDIQTYTIQNNGKKLLATAFPVLKNTNCHLICK
ncbi:Endoribonuclease CG2145 [Anthophora quadrimaculata]